MEKNTKNSSSGRGSLDVLTNAARKQAAFSSGMAGENGYKTVTTFYQDLTIAEAFGPKAVRETYARVNKEWRDNVEYYTEFILCLNHKIFEHHEKKNEELADLYNELWQDADSWAAANWTGEDYAYYFSVTD